MKLKPLAYLLLFVCFSLVLSSCEDKDDWSDEKTAAHVNDWIYKEMSFWYYWNDFMPTNIDRTNDSEGFFESLLYKHNQEGGDHFSWIQKNYVDLLNLLSGYSSSEIGFNYRFVQVDQAGTVYAVVSYIKRGTDAETKGIERGMAIAEVNGKKITVNNYGTAFPSNASSYKLGILSSASAVTNIEVKAVTNYAENPIYLDTIYTKNSKKIGYVVYNFFATDRGNGSYDYDKQLAATFERHLNAGVTNLVLDLRYNGGGSTRSAQYLASALIPNRATSKIFTNYEYNYLIRQALIKEGQKDALIDHFVDKVNNKYEIPRLGDKLEKLYIITGNGTASASELIINGLNPFMKSKIVQIGETTYGKNVASISIYEKSDKHNKWGMQPIVAKLSNADGFSDYANGFVPNYMIKELDYQMLNLGNEKEVLLSKALELITGQRAQRSAKAQISSLKELKSASSESRRSMFIPSDRLNNLNITE